MSLTNGRGLLGVLAVLALALGIAACGGGNDASSKSEDGGGSIESHPANARVTLTIGSQSSPEQALLKEIYGQALAAAGYKVNSAPNSQSGGAALKAVQTGQISGYPEQTGTALASFGVRPEEVPASPTKAWEKANEEFAKEGLEAFEPTPFAATNAIGTLTTSAKQYGLKKISDLNQFPQGSLALYGPLGCRRQFDCLVGLEKAYGLKVKLSELPADAMFGVLVNREANISILYSTDQKLFTRKDEYVILKDDKHAFRGGNFIFVTRKSVAKEAGPDYEKTIRQVQKGLTLRTIQELNGRMTFEAETPKEAAAAYLRSRGYVE